MRVGMVASRFRPRRGGVETHVERLAEHLGRRGVEVEVLTQDGDRALPPVEQLAGVTVRRFHLPAGAPHELVAPGLLRWVRGQRYDLLHAHNYHALPGLAASVCSDAPLVLTPHYHGDGRTPLRRLAHRPYGVAAGALLARAASVICVSDTEAGVLHRRHPGSGPVTVIPNGIDPGTFVGVEPWPPGGPLLLSVARLEAYKRVDVVVRSLVDLPAEVRLAIVGDGPERGALEALVGDLGLSDRVRLTGAVDDADLRRWYVSADCVVSMSSAEAFGLTLAEARAAGAAVVASDIAAHLETAALDPAGIRTCAADPGEVAAAVRRALDVPPGPARDLPTWSTVAARTHEVYERSAA